MLVNNIYIGVMRLGDVCVERGVIQHFFDGCFYISDAGRVKVIRQGLAPVQGTYLHSLAMKSLYSSGN
jgi:hypothetical protein